MQPQDGDGAYGGGAYGGGEYGGGEYGGYSEPYVPTPTPPALLGRWTSACVPGAQKGSFQRLTFDITAERWDLAYDSFADAACAKRTVNVHIAGTYGFGVESTSAAGAWEGNFTFDTRELTADDKKTATRVGKACGIKKLKAGVKTDIHAKGCPALGLHPSARCTADFDLVAVEGGQLKFGARPADNDLCSVEKRPTALDPQLAFDYDWAGSGYPDCGAYMATMTVFASCDKVPAESRSAIKDSWGMMQDGLRRSGVDEAARRAINDACKQGNDALSQAMTAMGC